MLQLRNDSFQPSLLTLREDGRVVFGNDYIGEFTPGEWLDFSIYIQPKPAGQLSQLYVQVSGNGLKDNAGTAVGLLSKECNISLDNSAYHSAKMEVLSFNTYQPSGESIYLNDLLIYQPLPLQMWREDEQPVAFDRDTEVEILVNRSLAPTSFGAEKISVMGADGNPAEFSMAFDPDIADRFTLQFKANTLREGMVYTVSLLDGTRDSMGVPISGSMTFLTSGTAIVDTTPPTVPSDLQVSATDTTATITWSASTDDVGVSGYRVTVDQQEAVTVREERLALTGLQPETEYAVKVTAFDAAGNESEPAQITVKTLEKSPVVLHDTFDDIQQLEILPNTTGAWNYESPGCVSLVENPDEGSAEGDQVVQIKGTSETWPRIDTFLPLDGSQAHAVAVSGKVMVQEGAQFFLNLRNGDVQPSLLALRPDLTIRLGTEGMLLGNYTPGEWLFFSVAVTPEEKEGEAMLEFVVTVSGNGLTTQGGEPVNGLSGRCTISAQGLGYHTNGREALYFNTHLEDGKSVYLNDIWIFYPQEGSISIESGEPIAVEQESQIKLYF